MSMSWRFDPKAVEAVDYLLSIGFNSDDFFMADAEAAGDIDLDDSDGFATDKGEGPVLS